MFKEKLNFSKVLNSLIAYTTLTFILAVSSPVFAAANDAKKQAGGGGTGIFIAIGVVVVVLGIVAFAVIGKKGGKSSAATITPPKAATLPSNVAKTPVTAPNIKSPVTAPNIKSPSSNAPSQPSAPVSTPVQNIEQAPISAPISAPPVINTPKMPEPASTPQPSQGLFDSNKLSSDLDNIFKDQSGPSVTEEAKEAKKAPLFDSNQLDDDLDALFVEVNKKPDPKKEEKKGGGLFDSKQLDSDLDSLFGAPTPSATPTPVAEPAPAFNLDSLDFLSSDTPKKEEPKSDPFAMPNLDLSSLTGGSTSTPSTQESSAAFNLDSLDFLSSDTPKKEESKSDAFALPTIDLSSLTSSPEPKKETPKQDLSQLAKPSGNIDLSTTTMGINISDYLSSMSAPAKTEEKKDEGVISIGKMTVDSNALEEIIKKAEKGGKAGLTTTQVITAVKGKTLDTLLVDINNNKGVKGSIIVGKDGLVIANTMPSDVDKDLVGALTSSLFSNMDTQAKKLKKGNLKRLTVETDTGIYILNEIEMGTLVVFSENGQNINFSNVFKAISAVTGKK